MGKRNYQLSDEAKGRIRKIVEFHYGFKPNDYDIEWIDGMLRNNYAVLHEQGVINELAAKNASDDLLKHRDRIGNTSFQRVWHEKSIFRYLTLASMCFRAGIPAGTVSLCRTAIEAGLRERLAEEKARRKITTASQLPEATWSELKGLNSRMLDKLIDEAQQEGIIDKQKIEEVFQDFKFGDQSSRRILDKFIHGDIVWMVDFIGDREEDARVIGAKDKLEEYKIISDMNTHQIAIGVLRAAYKISEILYFHNV